MNIYYNNSYYLSFFIIIIIICFRFLFSIGHFCWRRAFQYGFLGHALLVDWPPLWPPLLLHHGVFVCWRQLPEEYLVSAGAKTMIDQCYWKMHYCFGFCMFLMFFCQICIYLFILILFFLFFFLKKIYIYIFIIIVGVRHVHDLRPFGQHQNT